MWFLSWYFSSYFTNIFCFESLCKDIHKPSTCVFEEVESSSVFIEVLSTWKVLKKVEDISFILAKLEMAKNIHIANMTNFCNLTWAFFCYLNILRQCLSLRFSQSYEVKSAPNGSIFQHHIAQKFTFENGHYISIYKSNFCHNRRNGFC